jgi:hypothetical protein
MTFSPPTAQYPVFESSLLVGKEAPSTPGTEAAAFISIPTGPLNINPNYTPVEDMNLRGSNTKVFDLQYAGRYAEVTIPESPVYADTIGVPLLGVLGDYYSTGTATGTPWTTSGALVPGAGPIPGTVGSAATAGTFIQIDSVVNSEVVKVGTGSTTSSTVVDPSTPIRFNHASGTTIQPVIGPYTHKLSLLNMISSTGNTGAQPPTWTVMHRNGIAPTNSADRYLYGHFNEIKLSAKDNGWFTWDGKVTSYTRSAPSASFVPAFSGVTAKPAWMSNISLAGSQVFNITDLDITLTRDLDTIQGANGVQDPYVIGMGPLAANFDMTFNALVDQSILAYLENNTKPTFSWTISNGLTGTSAMSFSIAAQMAAFKAVPLAPVKNFWGVKATGELLANTSNSGNSGGYSPLMVTIVNQTPTL